MNKVNSIVICRDNFDSEEAFKSAIRDAIVVLLDNEYIMTVRYDEKGLGIVTIDYDSDDPEIWNAHPYWLTTEEWETIYFERQAKEDEE